MLLDNLLGASVGWLLCKFALKIEILCQLSRIFFKLPERTAFIFTLVRLNSSDTGAECGFSYGQAFSRWHMFCMNGETDIKKAFLWLAVGKW